MVNYFTNHSQSFLDFPNWPQPDLIFLLTGGSTAVVLKVAYDRQRDAVGQLFQSPAKKCLPFPLAPSQVAQQVRLSMGIYMYQAIHS